MVAVDEKVDKVNVKTHEKNKKQRYLPMPVENFTRKSRHCKTDMLRNNPSIKIVQSSAVVR